MKKFMGNHIVEQVNYLIVEILIEILIFGILSFIGIFIYNRIKNSSNRLFNLKEFLPEDEIYTLKQVSYLIMAGASFFIVISSLSYVTKDLIVFCIMDIVISWLVAISLDLSSNKNKILFILLVPYGALTIILFGYSIVGFIDLIHFPVFIYFTKVYYDKFRQYTDNNGLGITIALLFIIVFVSFLITQIVEGVNPIDSLVMVSNAFTSNGYTVLGHTIPGKINSIFLVWGGYILSGVGTATLTAAIIMKHFNERFDELNELIKENKKD